MPEEIINRVANSKLKTFDLEEIYPDGKRVVFDIKDWLFEKFKGWNAISSSVSKIRKSRTGSHRRTWTPSHLSCGAMSRASSSTRRMGRSWPLMTRGGACVATARARSAALPRSCRASSPTRQRPAHSSHVLCALAQHGPR